MRIFKKCKFILEVAFVTFAIFGINSFSAHLATSTHDCSVVSVNFSPEDSKTISSCKQQTIYDILSMKYNDIYDTFYTQNKQ